MKKAIAVIISAALTVATVTSCTAKKSVHTPPPKAEWSAYDSLIQDIKAEVNPIKREQMLHKAEDMLMSTYCVIPLAYASKYFLCAPELEGIYHNQLGGLQLGYGQRTDGKKEYSICISGEPATLDPNIADTSDSGDIDSALFSGLVTYDKNDSIVGQLAKDWTIAEDGLTYTFHLHENLKWSDGTRLDANDFVYSWNRLIQKETAASAAYMLDSVKRNADGTLALDVEDDGNTLVVHLESVCSYFLGVCAYHATFPVPKESVEAGNPSGTTPAGWCTDAGFVTSGPYTITSWAHDRSFVMTKNPHYFDADNVSIEKINFMLSNDSGTTYSAFQSGDIDLMTNIPTDEFESLEKTGKLKIRQIIGISSIIFNEISAMFEGKTLEQATAVRKAISMLIDRDYICDGVMHSGQTPANTFVPVNASDGHGGHFAKNTAEYTYPDEKNIGYFDPYAVNNRQEETLDEAKKLLISAGYEFDNDGMLSAATPLHFTYLINAASTNVAIAESIQQDLLVLGIDMEIVTEDWSVMIADRRSGNYDAARSGWNADYDDAINMLEIYTTFSENNDPQFGRNP